MSLQNLAAEAHTRVAAAQRLRSQLAADVEAVRCSVAALRRRVQQRYEAAVMDHDASLEQDPALLFDERETESERESERARTLLGTARAERTTNTINSKR